MAKILLVRTSMVSEVNPCVSHPLGILYLAAVLARKSHRVKIHDLRVEPGGIPGLLRVADSFQPDVIGLSSLTVESPQMNEVARRLKARAPGRPILAGGPHATSYPERVLDNPDVDVAVIGEAERTILELMPSLEQGVVPAGVLGTGTRVNGERRINPRQPPIEDLDGLPFPAWDHLNLPGYSRRKSMSTLNPRPYMTLFTSRACPYQCIYCHHVFGKGFRARSPENVLEEMETLIRDYGIRDFELVDDIFNLNRLRAQKICDLILQRGLKVNLAFPTALRADLLTPDLIRSLRRAGTVSSAFAIETASPRLQQLVRKNLDLEKAREAINYASEIGIVTTGFFMLGFPTETREEVLETIRFASALKLHTAQFFIVTPFLGTEMAELFREKYKGLQVEFSDYDYNKGTYNLSEVETAELYRLQRYANLKFYFHPSRVLRIFKGYPNKRLLARRFFKMVQLKILTGRRGSFVEPA